MFSLRFVLTTMCVAGIAASNTMMAPSTMRLRGGDRKYFIAGNWKMNPATLDEAKTLAADVSSMLTARFRPELNNSTDIPPVLDCFRL